MDFTSTALVYRVENVTLEYILTNATFPEVANPGVDVSAHLLESVDFLTAQLHDSLQCTSGKEVQLHDAKAASVTGVAFDILNIQVQAYMNTTTNTFGTAENCEAPHNSDIVPIAVGCALAVLVIIVLVAYLIGRRRSRQQGYQSV
jgi:lysosomal-associated membrane protein 1/2